MSDVGYAEDSFERPTSSVWYGDKPAVLLDIRRAMGENTVAVIEGVRARLQTIERSLPKSVKLTVVRDDSKFIYASVASLEEHLIFGSLFAAIVVMFFIRNIRAVIIASLAIPASIISSFTLMRVMGFTLNNMTLLGITLAVGIVIDDAIVVLENIFRYIEEKNCTPFEAAIQGTREVALAVMATTLSLVVIFLPIAFMNGYAKRFINPFGWTMAFSIMVSMLVSFTLTPMLSSRFLKLSDAVADHKTKEHGFFHWLDTLVRAAGELGARSSGHHHRASRLVTFLLTFPLNRMVGREFVPERGHGRVDGSHGRAGRDLARRDRGDGVQRPEGAAGHRGRRRRSSRWSIPAAAASRAAAVAAPRRTSISTVQALPLEERKQHAGADHQRRCGSGWPSIPAYRPSITVAQRAGQRRGHGRLRDLGRTSWDPTSTQLADYSMKALAAAQQTAEPRRAEVEPERLEPGDSRRGRSPARRRSRRADGDDRQHAAAGRGRRRSDFVLQGRAGAVPGQDPRAREPAARRAGDRPADRAVGRPARSGSTTSRRSSAASGPSALQRSNRQFTVS